MTTWTPKTKQSETWSEQTQPNRVFDPHVFDRLPIFDTGSSAGVWDDEPRQQEIWTAA